MKTLMPLLPVFCFASLLNPTNGFSVDRLLKRHPCTSGMANRVNRNSFHRDHPHGKIGIGTMSMREKVTCLHSSDSQNDLDSARSPIKSIMYDIRTNPAKSIYFSLSMTVCGATLGPFLDSYHSLFGVLTYNTPLMFPIIEVGEDGSELLTCVTTYWVPPLFGLAGFLIGWLYIFLDALLLEGKDDGASRLRFQLFPKIPKVLLGVSYFTFQYWLSGVLFASNFDRTYILFLMSALSAGGFCGLDMTLSGFIVSTATAIGGPLIEIGLISFLPETWAYHYNDAGETGYFPLWIIPVYFLGGPANGNLARAVWNSLGNNLIESTEDDTQKSTMQSQTLCTICQNTRAVPCPNCDDGTYITYGQKVICKACRGKGRVICRSCFSEYGDDPNDIESIRRIMDRIPD